MAKKVSNAIGIDIGSQKIKVVEVRSKGGNPEVIAMGYTDTPEGAVDHTGIYNPEAVGDALKALLSEIGASSKQAVVSVAGQASVLVRTLPVPRMNDEELRSHMEWEINRNIPFAESNVMSAYHKLADDDENSPNMDVVMAIAPQSAIDSILVILQRAKRLPIGVDVEPLALARSLVASHSEEFSGQVLCVVEVGLKSTSINIYRDGKLLMPRQIPIGGELFTRALADADGMTVDDAENMKLQAALIPQSEIDAARAYASNPFGGYDYQAPMDTTQMDYGTLPDDGTQQLQAYNPFADDPLPSNPFLAPDASAAAPANPFADPSAVPAAPDATQDVSSLFPPAAPIADPMFDPLAALEAPQDAVPLDDYSTTDVPGGAPAFDPFASNPGEYNPGGAAFDPFSSGSVPAAISNEDPEVLRKFNSIRPVLEEFVAEARRSIDYFRSQNGEVNRILLCGGGAYMKGFAEYLGASLNFECSVYNPFVSIPAGGKKIAPALPEDEGSTFAMALGTALHAFFEA